MYLKEIGKGLKIIIWIVFFIVNTQSLYAQASVYGIVLDKNSLEPIRASVLLKLKKDSTIVSFGFSDDNGYFSLENGDQKPIALYLEANSLGYKKTLYSIEENDPDSINILLSSVETQLNQVILQDTIPIRKKGDTLFYNVSEFSTGREKVVEDILKNLPGVDVDKNGTVRVEGKEIEKIMVEGDDFFEKGYQILSQSMPSWAIEKVEVLNKYNENRLLKNVENSEKVALNLSLKPDARLVWFGDMYGLNNFVFPKNRYQLLSNLMQFGKNHKFYTLINSNNIGITQSTKKFKSLTGFDYDDKGQNINKIDYIESPKIQIDEEKYKFNNTQSISLNYIYKHSDSSRLKILSLYTWDNIRYNYTSNITFLSQNSTNNSYIQDFNLKNKVTQGFGKIMWDYDISKKDLLKVHTSIHRNNDLYNTLLNLNSISSKENENDLGTKIKGNIDYFHSFEASSVLQLSSTYFKNSIPQKYNIDRYYYQDLFPNDKNITSVEQNSLKEKEVLQNKVIFKSKSNKKDLLEIGGKTEWINHKFSNTFYLIDDKKNSFKQEEVSNNIVLTENNYGTLVSYTPYYSDKLNLKFQLSAEQTFFTDTPKQIQYKNSNFSYNPKAFMKWEINDMNKIGGYLEFISKGLDFEDMMSNYLWKDAKTFTKGLSKFTTTNNTNIFLRYFYGSYKSDFSFDITSQFVFFEKYTATKVLTYPYFNFEEKYIAKNQPIYNLKTSASYFLESIKNMSKAEFFFSTTSNLIQYNQEKEFPITLYNYDYYLELRSLFSGMFNYNISYNIINEDYKTSNNSKNNLHSRGQLSLMFQWTKTFWTQLEYNNYYFKNLPRNQNQYHFMNSEFIYFYKNNWQFFLKADNLLNMTHFTDYNLNNLYSAVVKYDLYPRYIFIGTKYKF